MSVLYEATLGKNVVSGLFFQFSIFFFPQKKFQFFSYKKRKKDKKRETAAARVAIISATCWTGNKLFFKGGLNVNKPSGQPHQCDLHCRSFLQRTRSATFVHGTFSRISSIPVTWSMALSKSSSSSFDHSPFNSALPKQNVLYN